jgi:hypothetical protein
MEAEQEKQGERYVSEGVGGFVYRKLLLWLIFGRRVDPVAPPHRRTGWEWEYPHKWPKGEGGRALILPWPHDTEVGDLKAALGMQPSRFRACGVQLQAADQDSSWPISVLGAQLPTTHRSPQLTAR